MLLQTRPAQKSSHTSFISPSFCECVPSALKSQALSLTQIPVTTFMPSVFLRVGTLPLVVLMR